MYVTLATDCDMVHCVYVTLVTDCGVIQCVYVTLVTDCAVDMYLWLLTVLCVCTFGTDYAVCMYPRY